MDVFYSKDGSAKANVGSLDRRVAIVEMEKMVNNLFSRPLSLNVKSVFDPILNLSLILTLTLTLDQ